MSSPEDVLATAEVFSEALMHIVRSRLKIKVCCVSMGDRVRIGIELLDAPPDATPTIVDHTEFVLPVSSMTNISASNG